ncbi:uncharacterized protein KNAG_0L00670 [Huiozyma naganishii CBS 8797]|uniref:Flo11 domain-containing protein n=1 Tax=Huiozyma naganishii (strain ATCC MYA-139 / BCRC 22969 / CBS 8797 / KCTC 17520 / NBRC 10181 / NCYC 3082 / Yp74L-3) TaxID=1071383 RepID=J7RCU0_HUIN7|nr:hypothetical protein KNAG_0L00670 [Kazachstania naganishii CBS 8797]CCK72690.1 hypothetical protein KNAG_0L00670 [Kazachstania naganishii CBS 8797]
MTSSVKWWPLAILALVNTVSAFEFRSFNSSSLGVENNTEITNDGSVISTFVNNTNLVQLAPGANVTTAIEDFANTTMVVKNSNGTLYTNITKNPIGTTDSKKGTAEAVEPFVLGWDEYQTISEGSWWSPWYPISECSKDDPNSSVNLKWGYSYQWSGSTDGSFDTTLFRNSVTFDWSKAVSRSGTYSCSTGDDGVAQVWYQQEVGWAEIQKRHCSTTLDGSTCSSWNTVQHVDAPLEGEDSYRLACSESSGCQC